MRWILRAVGAIVVLAMLAVAGLLLIPDQRIAAYVGEKFQEATGRELRIAGEIGPTVWPMLGVRLEGIQIANADWAGDAPMLKADGLLVGVDPLALLSGEVKIRKIELLRPQIRIERAANGQGNWEFAAPAGVGGANGNGGGNGAGGDAGSGVPPFSLGRALIRQGALAWIDHGAGSRMDLSGMDATLRIPDFNGPASMDLKARANGQPVEAKLEIGRFDRFIEGGAVALEADLSVAGNRILFNGEAGFAPLLAKGAIDSDLARIPALFAALGRAAPDIPEGLGRKAVLRGRIAYSGEGGGRVALNGAEITLDHNQLRGDLVLALGGKRPRLTGSLASPLLDLSGLSGEEDEGTADAAPGGAGDGAGQEPWPTDPIDVSPLSLLDADLALDLGGLKLAGANIDRARLGFTLERTRAVLAFREVSAYGGSVAGQFVVNGRNGLSVGGDLAVVDVALQPLLRDMADYERLIGTGNFSIKFLGVGDSVAAIMRSLKGEGALSLADGEILGLDLVGMLRNFDTSYRGEGKKTIYDAITASFVIRDGVLQNDDLLFKAPLATAKGKGRVDIGAKTIDYRVEPVALARASAPISRPSPQRGRGWTRRR